MKPTLEELPAYISKTLPQPKFITKMEIKSEIDAVTFQWQGRRFLVRKSLQVLEMRGNKLFITGASTLAQSVLLWKNSNEKVLTTVVDLLSEAEQLITTRRRTEAGLRLLEVVNGSLLTLVGGKGRRKLARGRHRASEAHAAGR